MKITAISIAILAILTLSKMNGQVLNVGLVENVSLSDVNFYAKKENIEKDLKSYSGSKYLDENFSRGFILDRSKDQKIEAYLRYNILYDAFEWKSDQDEMASVVKRVGNIDVVYNNGLYVFKEFIDKDNSRKEGYLKKIGSYDGMSFMKRYVIKPTAPREAKTQYEEYEPGRLVQEASYFKMGKDNFTLFEFKKRNILKLFPDNEARVKEIIKEEKLKFRDDKDLKFIIEALNTDAK